MCSGSVVDDVETGCEIDEDDDSVSIHSHKTEKWYVTNICDEWVSVCHNLYVKMSFLYKVSRDMSWI